MLWGAPNLPAALGGGLLLGPAAPHCRPEGARTRGTTQLLCSLGKVSVRALVRGSDPRNCTFTVGFSYLEQSVHFWQVFIALNLLCK